MVHLILGGARSGKSRFAEQNAQQAYHMLLAEHPHAQLHYVATAIAFDDEMRARIAHHQQQRDDNWQEHECPYQLVEQLKNFSCRDIVLVDCLTLWMNNIIYNHGQQASETQIKQQVSGLCEAVEQSAAKIILVSNEVGLGIIPMGEVSRLFVDNAGWMNQALAKVAQRVSFVAAGLPMTLKSQ
ncbi:bifunctional adenosylcobinamide kinase/adenosylcobinamide-phosphate guanylyltransferase [Vibrio aestuarianus]|uniref:Bifunctional adenosylcobalamin biosynthesis protein n=1 Tax=Vibrio aestuarianus TaxID=28171 RepID=A0ABD7YH94_9VIBR|nr:bifunctional adenosylcobinamide kinase/adenosylcobinamide-phosphate guanylyltransferase [Vibrio aestuarianus]MDE1235135.1 bifunctional adenosylcobinamide kinase/adenosylcobinamide-phosphate guanylyltransferase [Vibrio aestuarianus]MDE1245982.1 bifunctional adenosylcobinamide kinase/adenosylcobinamide-phosphate guanylyltransferase [Vibrio aestuarianus]MDE1310820.1 bifunctional adenosylcobinamide kinase/adenosylcobinamide-phosphate guanylyltransferase [Vibrio aestuarianus]NGZ63227.1 bifunction